MRSIIISGCIVLATLGPGLAHAGAERVGTTAANFLTVGSGAQVLGMAGATLALTNGVGSTTWNPAALARVGQTELTLSHTGMAGDLAQEWIGAGGPVGPTRLRWSLSALYQSQGSFAGRDASNNSTGSFNASSMAVGGYLARSFGRVALLGFGGKWVNETMGPAVRGSGATFDAGLQLHMGMVGLGFAAQNFGGSMSFSGESYSFPANYGAGISIDHRASGLKADVDVNFPSAYYNNVRGGVEWSWRERVALRAGYRKELGANQDDILGGPSFGVGAGAYGLWLDYAYQVSGNGDGEHRIGLSLRPGAAHLGDPFGQRDMPRDWDSSKQAGPPAPAKTETPEKKTKP